MTGWFPMLGFNTWLLEQGIPDFSLSLATMASEIGCLLLPSCNKVSLILKQPNLLRISTSIYIFVFMVLGYYTRSLRKPHHSGKPRKGCERHVAKLPIPRDGRAENQACEREEAVGESVFPGQGSQLGPHGIRGALADAPEPHTAADALDNEGGEILRHRAAEMFVSGGG